jgi:hypothetical protein
MPIGPTSPVGIFALEEIVKLLRRPWIALLIVLASFAAFGSDSAALNSPAQISPLREFAADIVRRDSDGGNATTIGRLYAARGKVHIETVDLPGGFFLIDPAASTWLVRPAQRVYMNARRSSTLTQIFVPIEAADPCPGWRIALQDAGVGRGAEHWGCERLGDLVFRVGTLNPAPEDRDANDSIERRFIDQRLQFPIKALGADGVSLTLENIQLASQPDQLFSVPSDYRLLDPQALVERIKHSDVWAAPADP